MAYVEMVYGKPVREIILEILNNGASVVATADRLGIGKPQFYKWMGKLNIKKKVVWGCDDSRQTESQVQKAQ